MNYTHIERHLKKNGKYDRIRLAHARYGYTVIKNELPKFVLLFIFFAVIGYVSEFLFYTAILGPVRIFSGGLHLKSNMGCFITSFMICFLAIYLMPFLMMPHLVYLAMSVTSVMLTIWISPLDNPMRPVKTHARYINLKKKAGVFVIISSVVLLVLYLYKFESYYVIGVWALFINAMQLAVLKVVNTIRKGEDHENVKATVK